MSLTEPGGPTPPTEPNGNGSTRMTDRMDTRSILAIFTIAGVFLLAILVLFVPEAKQQVATQVLMAYLPLATLVLGWYFASSKTSDDKTAIIQAQLPAPK